MLAKLTSKNQITLPKKVIARFADTNYFEVHEEGGKIVLQPVKVRGADMVRDKLASLGITMQDVKNAVQWARN